MTWREWLLARPMIEWVEIAEHDGDRFTGRIIRYQLAMVGDDENLSRRVAVPIVREVKP